MDGVRVTNSRLHIDSLTEKVPYRIACTDETVSIWNGPAAVNASIQIGLRPKGRGEMVLDRDGFVNLEGFAPQSIHIVTRHGSGVVIEVERSGRTDDTEEPEPARPMTLWQRFRAVIR